MLQYPTNQEIFSKIFYTCNQSEGLVKTCDEIFNKSGDVVQTCDTFATNQEVY